MRVDREENWKDFRPQCGAAVREIGVGRIFGPVPVAISAERLRLITAEREHRADDRQPAREFAPGADGGKAFRTGTAQQAQENCFELIFGVMAGGDVAAAMLGRQTFKGGIAVGSGCGFVIAPRCFGGNLGRCEGKAESMGESLCRGQALGGF